MGMDNKHKKAMHANTETNWSVKKWFDALDQYNSEPFILDRAQPITPDRSIFEPDQATKNQ